MSKIWNNSASNAGPKNGTDSHWEEIEKTGYTEGKAHYNKRFAVRRALERMCRDSYCGVRYSILISSFRTIGVANIDIYLLLNATVGSETVNFVCNSYPENVAKEIKKLLKEW